MQYPEIFTGAVHTDEGLGKYAGLGIGDARRAVQTLPGDESPYALIIVHYLCASGCTEIHRGLPLWASLDALASLVAGVYEYVQDLGDDAPFAALIDQHRSHIRAYPEGTPL